MISRIYNVYTYVCLAIVAMAALASCSEDDFVVSEQQYHNAVLIKCAVADYITEESDMTRGVTRGMEYDDNMITKLDLLIFETQGSKKNGLLKHLTTSISETGKYTWDITGQMPKDYLKNKNVAIYLIANYYPGDHGGKEITDFNPSNANTFFAVSSTDPFPPGEMLNHGIVMSQVMEGTKNYTTDGNNNLIMNFNNLERVMAKAEFFVADENTQNKLQASEPTVTGLTNSAGTIKYTDNKGTEISKLLNIYQPVTKYTEANDNSLIKYTITPEKYFTLNKLSFYAARYGTDGGKFDIKIKRGDVTKEIKSFIPERYNNKISVDISGYKQESGQTGKYSESNGNLDSFRDSETAELDFNVSNEGNYVLSFKSASKREDAKAMFEIKNDNSETLYTEIFDLPNTSDWQKYITKIGSISEGLTSGNYKIVITFNSSSGQYTANIKDIELRKEDDSDSMDGDKDAGTEISFAEFDVNEISGSTDPIEIYFYVYNLDTNKQIYLGDVAITGMVTTTSEIKEYKVQNYTKGYTLFNIGDVDKSTTTEIYNKTEDKYENTDFTLMTNHPESLIDAENNSFAFYFYPNYWFDSNKNMAREEPIIPNRQTHVLVKASYQDKEYYYKVPVNFRLPKYSDAHQSTDHFNSKIDDICDRINYTDGADNSALATEMCEYIINYLYYTYETCSETNRTKLQDACNELIKIAVKEGNAKDAKTAVKAWIGGSDIYNIFKDKNITEAERLCRIQRNHHYKITVNIDKPGGETVDEAVYIMPAPYGDITARPEF